MTRTYHTKETIMRRYRIINPDSGADLGVWTADSPEEALDQLIEQAGARGRTDADDEPMDRVDDLVVEAVTEWGPLPPEHDWAYAGADRGDIRVHVYTCRACGLAYQRADPADPDTPPALRSWEAIRLPGEEAWDDEAPIPACPALPGGTP
jgi:hypothetical protein